MLLSGKYVVFPLIYEQDCSSNSAEGNGVGMIKTTMSLWERNLFYENSISFIFCLITSKVANLFQ